MLGNVLTVVLEEKKARSDAYCLDVMSKVGKSKYFPCHNQKTVDIGIRNEALESF